MKLKLDQLIRSVAINRAVPHMFFLGAGTSITSEVPSAERCIREWKRDIFLSQNPGLEEQFSELSLPGIRDRIQAWLDRQGEFPPAGSPDEYGFYIEACFPIPADRRAYFAEKVREARPHIGYHILSKLAEFGLVESVWTTNFDGLVARAAASYSVTPLEVGIDSQERLPRQVRSGELLTVSLHGDYRYDSLKNTLPEIQHQEVTLRKALIEQLKAHPCLVLGYSGRDRSIMQAFEEAYASEGTGTLYWCGIAEEVTSDVDRLLHVAKDAGRQAFYIPILGFDDLMTRLGLFASEGPQRDAIKSLVASLNGADSQSREAFSIPKFNAATVIKSNAFEVECPAEVFAFDLKEWPDDHVWQYLRSLAADSKFVAAPFKGRVLSIGLLDSIKDKFGNNINGSIQRVPITTNDFRYEDGAVTRIMREAIVRSLVEKSGVNSDGHSELWLTKPTQTVVANGVEYEVFESVLIFLRRLGDSQFLLLKPTVRVLDKAGNAAPDEVAGNVKLVILGGQYNPKFNAAINTWRKVLIDDLSNPAIIEYPYDSGSTFRFRIRKAPIFAEIGARYRRSAVNLSRVPTQLLRHKGFELDEPSLVFARRDGNGTATDTHPMRGILENRPFDFPLTTRLLANEVRVGVVCPEAESKLLEDFLQNAHQRQRVRSNAEYLLDYPGFQQAYGLPLNLPNCGDRSWVTCNEPAGNDAHAMARDLARTITVAIENLRAASAISVVLILVPDRWQLFEGYTKEDERFDLHDFVKAYCVQKGITSQFLRQITLAKSDLCQLWWWLSLALYVKAMRTPWVLESLEQETAFVGLGFSISPTAERGRHVILGCSHVYSQRGEGLQYRLSKIENPVVRGSNPFMSRDDARRVGETTRQLFFDSRLRLPDRVVFHKRTPFLHDEREGLLEGLSGVQHVEMLEIQVDSALRYVASIIKGNTIDEDNFPVKRGTAVKLDDFSALVWVHGVTTAVNPRKKYFQGKRRIPAPVHIRRHLGNSDLNLVAEEILALSKMNWNTFNLYTKVPATIQSSNEIARIGALLERFGAESYDYRLFI